MRWPSLCRWLAAALITSSVTTGWADDPGWPRDVQVPGARLLLFQPQLETFEGREISGRAAVSLTPEGASDPTFGVLWVRGHVDVDRDLRTARIYDLRLERSRFPDDATGVTGIVDGLEREVPSWELDLSLDRLLTSLEAIEGARELAEGLGTEPPAIVVRDEPSVLVVVDGEPIVESLDGTGLSRIVNTPFLIVREAASGIHFLYAGTDAWYTADDLLGAWTYTTRVPDAVAALTPDATGVDLPTPEDAAHAGVTPAVVVATEPTELIFTDGTPSYTPLADASLMYVSNTDSTLILELETQRHFTVLSGRWFASDSLDGPWAFVEADALPAAFRDIPADSSIADVRIHVAGTVEAEEAVLDAQIPQTAAVERGRVDLDVVFDGDPVFEAIPGTDLRWAVNTEMQMLAAEGRYWVCDDAVWYVADTPTGPWNVAVERPDEVERIPPDNPNYNLKYAEIYGVTPDVVYAGYTPGYTHTYVHRVTVVHGSGFWHPHWHRTVFIPRHATWGFHVRLHPWWGWSSGVVFSNGRFTFGLGFGGWSTWHRGWWGPVPFHSHWRGHHRGFYAGWHRGFYSGARAGLRVGARAGYRGANLFRAPTRTGARIRNAAPRAGNANLGQISRLNSPQSVSRTQANNVLAGQNGNVFRSTGDGQLQQRTGGQWSRPQGGGSRPALQRTQAARQRGTMRSNNFRGGGRGGVRR